MIGRPTTYKNRKEVMEIFKRNIIENNIKNASEYRDKISYPTISSIKRHYGITFNEAVYEVLNIKLSDNSRKKTVEEYKKELQELINDLGYVPKYKEILDRKLYKFGNQQLNFTIGYSYSELIKELGYDIDIRTIHRLNISREETLNRYIEISRELGRYATVKDLSEENSKVDYDNVRKYFGSIDNIRKESNLDFNYMTNNIRRFSKNKIEFKIKTRLAAFYNIPNIKEILEYYKNDKDFPNTTQTIRSYFDGKTIKEILEEIKNTIK